MINFENLNKCAFDGVGEWGIPAILGCDADNLPEGWVGFNAARGIVNPASYGVHFYLDDYRFRAVWNQPDRYIDLLRSFSSVLQPDFSLYADMPRAMQLYNHYRKQWVAAYWQLCGIRVIPTIGWSDKESYSWCFDGVPRGSVVSVSSVGTQKGREARSSFLDGYFTMLERIAPEKVLFHGKVPAEVPMDRVICIGDTFTAKFDRMRRAKKWAAEGQAEEREEKLLEEAAETLEEVKAAERTLEAVEG